jgi:uncharacterized small protein (DUF1192 family)
VADDLGKERLKILGEIGNLTKQINAFNEAGLVDTIKTNTLNKERLKLAKELRSVNEQIRNEQRQLYVDATNSVKGLGSLYDNLKKSEMKRIEMMRSAGDLSDIAVDRGNTLADLNQRIAQLTSDQSLEREILQDQFDAEIKKFAKQKGISEKCIQYGLQEIDNKVYIKTLQKEIEKKTKELKENNTFILKNKIIKYFYSKGYEPELTIELLK